MSLVPNANRFLKRLVDLKRTDLGYFAEQWEENCYTVAATASLFNSFCDNPTRETFDAWYNESQYLDDYEIKPLMLGVSVHGLW